MQSSNETDNETIYFFISKDGISPCDHSTFCYWPAFKAINEIEISKSFHIDNIIILGLKLFYKKKSI
jgi:hypothetical protein